MLLSLQLTTKLEQARRFAVQSRQQLEGAQRAVPPARQAVAEAQEEVRRRSFHPGQPCTARAPPSCSDPLLIPCCARCGPWLQNKKYTDGGWYPGKVLGGKDKQQKKAGEWRACLSHTHSLFELHSACSHISSGRLT